MASRLLVCGYCGAGRADAHEKLGEALAAWRAGSKEFGARLASFANLYSLADPVALEPPAAPDSVEVTLACRSTNTTMSAP